MQNGGQIGDDAALGTRRKAVVISVSDYANNLQPLDFCKKDGQEVHRVLKSIGYEIPDSRKLVGQVNYETMKDTIYDFFTDPTVKAEDVLLFYYSGHGVPDVNGDVFLASSETNPNAPFRKGFSFYELTNTIERSNSTRIVTILDCCYSGAAKVSKGHEEDAAKLGTVAIDDKSRKLVQQSEGKCLLAASMGFQEAYGLEEKGHSIFTYYLLKGFRGAKSAVDEEGNVTPDTLGKYVFREIVNLPEDRRPKQKPIRKVEAGGDIILAHYPKPVPNPYPSVKKPSWQKNLKLLIPIIIAAVVGSVVAIDFLRTTTTPPETTTNPPETITTPPETTTNPPDNDVPANPQDQDGLFGPIPPDNDVPANPQDQKLFG